MEWDSSTRVYTLQPRLPRTKLELAQLGLLFLARREKAHCEDLRAISVRQCWRALFMGFDLVLGDVEGGGGSRKQSFAGFGCFLEVEVIL